jgi:ElaB/YqjD/DUF883 family membrane-anchored ribosome-binding protein
MSIIGSPSGREQKHANYGATRKMEGANVESSTAAKVAAAAHSAVDVAAQNLEKAEQALREAREAAGAKANATVRQARSYSEHAASSVKEYIHEYPLRSLGIAVAAGYLLLALLKTSHRRSGTASRRDAGAA